MRLVFWQLYCDYGRLPHWSSSVALQCYRGGKFVHRAQ